MNRHRPVKTFLVLALLASVSLVVAQERHLHKYHERIEFDGVVFAELTTIRTHDELAPISERVLYKDAQGVLLLLRRETTLDGNGAIVNSEISVSAVSSGEKVAIALHVVSNITLTVGSQSMQFADAEPLPQSVKDQAEQLLQANASQDFQDALERLARVGCYYSMSLKSLGSMLREAFFFDDIPAATNRDYTSEPTGVVIGFDPSETPPGTFEQPFGQAYWE